MRVAHKPGAIPLRPLVLSDIFDGAFRIIRYNPKATIGAAVLVSAVAMIVPIATGLFSGSTGGLNPDPNTGTISDSQVLSLLIARRLTRSIERLSAATRAIGRGEFDVAVDVGSQDEIALLSQSFNRMAGELKSRERQLEHAHLALVQSEKLAAFGQLGAGIAHEVKNPLAGIRGAAQLLKRRLAEPELARLADMIMAEADRLANLSDRLLHGGRKPHLTIASCPTS